MGNASLVGQDLVQVPAVSQEEIFSPSPPDEQGRQHVSVNEAGASGQDGEIEGLPDRMMTSPP